MKDQRAEPSLDELEDFMTYYGIWKVADALEALNRLDEAEEAEENVPEKVLE